jgi:hypothetical protein
VVLAGWQANHMREQMQCWAGGYSSNTFLAYCGNEHYGDYEHAAYVLGFEPKAQKMLREAAVVFLGTSRVQVTFSADTLRDFFSREQVTFYNAGFGYSENSSFGRMLWAAIQPHPQLLIINVDPYFTHFTDLDTPPTVAIKTDAMTVRWNTTQKKLFQLLHQRVCQIRLYCGNQQLTFFRRIDDGTVIFRLSDPRFQKAYPLEVNRGQPPEFSLLIRDAEDFLGMTKVSRKCVIFTTIPSDASDPILGKKVADALGVRFILPNVTEVKTFDHSHMTMESRERFAAAFLEEIRPILIECVKQSGRDF